MISTFFGIVFLIISLQQNDLNAIILSCILILLDNKEITVIVKTEK